MAGSIEPPNRRGGLHVVPQRDARTRGPAGPQRRFCPAAEAAPSVCFASSDPVSLSSGVFLLFTTTPRRLPGSFRPISAHSGPGFPSELKTEGFRAEKPGCSEDRVRLVLVQLLQVVRDQRSRRGPRPTQARRHCLGDGESLHGRKQQHYRVLRPATPQIISETYAVLILTDDCIDYLRLNRFSPGFNVICCNNLMTSGTQFMSLRTRTDQFIMLLHASAIPSMRTTMCKCQGPAPGFSAGFCDEGSSSARWTGPSGLSSPVFKESAAFSQLTRISAATGRATQSSLSSHRYTGKTLTRPVMVSRESEEWSSGICDCCDDVPDKKYGECLCLPLLDGFGLIPPITMSMRVSMRQRYRIRDTMCNDCLYSTFCGVCTWCQMSREMKRRNIPIVL
ncbi:hypothetical protein FQN60_000353, partial [Etheostoma spectabile]